MTHLCNDMTAIHIASLLSDGLLAVSIPFRVEEVCCGLKKILESGYKSGEITGEWLQAVRRVNLVLETSARV